MLKLKTSGNTLNELSLISLKPQKRRSILRGAGRKVRRDSRLRLRQQKDLENKRWKGRADGSKKRMLKKLGKHMKVYTSTEKADVTFSSNRIGQVAAAHQHGLRQTVEASDFSRPQNTQREPATRKQAKALRAAGYKIRKVGSKGWKRPSLSWITANLSMAQAGLVLRILKDQSKIRWDVNLPARSHLGQDREELKEMKNFMLSEAARLR